MSKRNHNHEVTDIREDEVLEVEVEETEEENSAEPVEKVEPEVKVSFFKKHKKKLLIGLGAIVALGVAFIGGRASGNDAALLALEDEYGEDDSEESEEETSDKSTDEESDE